MMAMRQFSIRRDDNNNKTHTTWQAMIVKTYD